MEADFPSVRLNAHVFYRKDTNLKFVQLQLLIQIHYQMAFDRL